MTNKVRKKVLMICYHMFSDSGIAALRSNKFVKYLGDFGWDREVLTAFNKGAKEWDKNQNVKIHYCFINVVIVQID